MKKKILFLCTGNSCRSQMAEGFGNKYLLEYNVSSAGTEARCINPHAIKSMNDIGIDISNQTSKKIDLSKLNSYDLIITLCGDVKGQCPVLENRHKHIHWDLQDPALIKGDNNKISMGFSKIRDLIFENIKQLKYSISI